MKKDILFVYLLLFLILNGNAQGWIKQESNTNSNLSSVYFLNQETGFAVGNGGVIIKTTDGGNHWIAKSSWTTNDFRSVCFIDSLTGFIISQNGLFKTKNGGDSWFLQDSAKFLVDIQFISQDTGFVAGSGIILKTTDRGTTWIKQNSIGGTVLSFYATDSKNMYIGADSNTIFKSIDGGENWFSQTSGFPSYIWDILFINKNIGYAVGGGFAQGSTKGTISKTTNGCAQWNSVLNFNGAEFSSIFFTTEKTGFVVGWNGNIFKTTNQGNNWIKQDSNTDYWLKSVFFTDSLTGYAVGSNGTILKTLTGGVSTSLNQVINSSIKFYPNPVSNVLHIELNNSGIQNSEILIFSLTGSLVVRNDIRGSNILLHLDKLRRGTYVAKIINMEQCILFKFRKE